MTKHTLALSDAIEGYFIHAQACRLSPQTLSGYNWALRKLEAYLGPGTPLAGITSTQIRDFLNSLNSPS